MKRSTLKIMLAGMLALTSGEAIAESAPRHLYKTIVPPVPVDIPPGKILVQELFWFGCPDCYRLEPEIETWLKNKPTNIHFEWLAVMRDKANWKPLTHTFYALKQLGQDQNISLHGEVFDAIHMDGVKVQRAEDLIEFMVKQGLERDAYIKAINNQKVLQATTDASRLLEHYGADSVPALIVNGRYLTTESIAGNQKNMILALEQMIQTFQKK